MSRREAAATDANAASSAVTTTKPDTVADTIGKAPGAAGGRIGSGANDEVAAMTTPSKEESSR